MEDLENDGEQLGKLPGEGEAGGEEGGEAGPVGGQHLQAVRQAGAKIHRGLKRKSGRQVAGGLSNRSGLQIRDPGHQLVHHHQGGALLSGHAHWGSTHLPPTLLET